MDTLALVCKLFCYQGGWHIYVGFEPIPLIMKDPDVCRLCATFKNNVAFDCSQILNQIPHWAVHPNRALHNISISHQTYYREIIRGRDASKSPPVCYCYITFQPWASFGFQVLSLPASVCVCMCGHEGMFKRSTTKAVNIKPRWSC